MVLSRPKSIRRCGVAASVLVAVALVATGAGCASSSEGAVRSGGATTGDADTSTAAALGDAASNTTESSAEPGLLYVQRAERAVLDTSGADAVLRFSGVDADTVWFQDRPGRQAGRMSTGQFVDGWAAAGFVEDPPNATVQIDGTDGDGADALPSEHVVELSSPSWDEATTTLTYTIRDDDGGGPSLPSTFGAASVFIDDAGSDLFRQATVSISNLTPGQELRVELVANGTDIAWSSGVPFGVGSAVTVSADDGPIPVERLDVSSSEVALTTSAEPAGGAVNLTMQVRLVAAPGIETFYVRSGSDPGVEVSMQLDGSTPQVVNQSPTLFEWSPS